MKIISKEWREDPSFPFKHHLYGLVELPGGKQEEKLLASYWLAREQWDWHVFSQKRGFFSKSNVGTSSTEEEAKEEIYDFLNIK